MSAVPGLEVLFRRPPSVPFRGPLSEFSSGEVIESRAELADFLAERGDLTPGERPGSPEKRKKGEKEGRGRGRGREGGGWWGVVVGLFRASFVVGGGGSLSAGGRSPQVLASCASNKTLNPSLSCLRRNATPYLYARPSL